MIIGGSGVAYVLYQSTTAPPENVKFLLDFTPTYFHLPYYYGYDQGYYKQNGINVSIIPGKASTAFTAIAAGQVDFALTDATTLVSGVAANITNVRIIGIIFQKSFFGVVYNKAKISTLQDLQGKMAGANNPSQSPNTKLFFALAKINGLNLSSITFQYGQATVFPQLVTTGKVDFVLQAVHDLASLVPKAAQNGIQLGFFPYAQYGLDIYGEVLVTTTQMIQTHPDLVRRFVVATMQSVTGAISNPDAAASALVKYQPQLNRTIMLAGYKSDISCCLGNVTSGMNPLTFGWIDPARMQTTVNLLVQGLGIKTPVNASALYTDSYVVHP